VYSVSMFTKKCLLCDRILGQENNSEEETVITCIGVQYVIRCRMIERYLKLMQNTIAYFHVSFILCAI
jgi:hypothetical protein